MSLNFDDLVENFKEIDVNREKEIATSRDVIRESKKAIYSVHRGDMENAKANISTMKDLIKNFKGTSSIREVAFQEFVEAVCFYEFIESKRIPSFTEFDVSSESYIGGICDLSGELVRKAINASLDGDYKTLFEIKRVLGDIYGELLKLDFKNGELRKKFDRVKYSLIKLEEVCLGVKQSAGVSGGCCGNGQC